MLIATHLHTHVATSSMKHRYSLCNIQYEFLISCFLQGNWFIQDFDVKTEARGIQAKKRRLGRAQSTTGDYCLLAGSPNVLCILYFFRTVQIYHIFI
ncbi:hypothetical protein Hanom_Chr01g00088421 [Helianthus anomalus]